MLDLVIEEHEQESAEDGNLGAARSRESRARLRVPDPHTESSVSKQIRYPRDDPGANTLRGKNRQQHIMWHGLKGGAKVGVDRISGGSTVHA